MDFYNLGKIGAKAHWEKLHKPIINHIQKNHTYLFKEKARLLGFIMGDGSISKLGKPASTQNHDICFYPDDNQMLSIFLSDFEKLYLKKPKVKNLGKYFSVRVSSKPACDDLRSFGEFTSLKWELPKKLKSLPEKQEWLRAIFDCEACIGKRQIQFQSVSQKGVESIKQVLQEFGIDTKIYIYDRKHINWNLNYILVISKKENIVKYKDLIGFNHSKKQEKLKILAGVPER